MIKIRKSLKFIILIFSLLAINNCIRKSPNLSQLVIESDYSPKTVFIHGTLFPIISNLAHTFDIPVGLNNAKFIGNKYVHGRLAYTLSQESPEEFSLDSFYLFGWSGKLSFSARKNAAIELYQKIKDFRGPITIIGHSHGGNIALLLAQVAKEHNNNNFKISRLILLATPVQKATEQYISSNIFEKIYSYYSSADLTQVLDPQGLHETNKDLTCKVPFFSKRTFNSHYNLKQAKILINKQSPGHLSFIFNKTFIKSIPKILNILDNLCDSEESSNCIINISSDQINLVSKESVSHFIPSKIMAKKSYRPIKSL